METKAILGPNEDVSVVITIGPDLKGMQITHISILEDLWHDYLYFKKQAESVSREVELFRHQRYLRAALLVLIAYLEGVANRWLRSVLKEQGKAEPEINRFIKSKSLEDKCKFLTDEAAKKNSAVNTPFLSDIKKLRNDLVHLKLGSNLKIFEGLTLMTLAETERIIDVWLSNVGKALGKERHPDTRSMGRKSAQGQDFNEDYSGDGLN
jgi:hypothetical protein